MVSSQRNGHPMPIAVVASLLVAIVDNNSQAYDTQIVHQIESYRILREGRAPILLSVRLEVFK